MDELKQKKFYSDSAVNFIIEQNAQRKEIGFSESLRQIVRQWNALMVALPKTKSTDAGYIAYLNGYEDPRD